MKKILLSCVTCLLAVGLLAGCDDEVEEVTPEDPNAGVVEPSGDDGGTVSGDDGSGTEKEPEPELAPQFLEVDELVDGESYYLGFPYSGTYTTEYYLFNGTTDSYGDYLQCSVYGTGSFEPTKVKVSITEADADDQDSVETIGLTFTALKDEVETDYTIYAWPATNGTYGEITFIETNNLATAKTGAVTEFTWDAERGTLNVTLSNGSWYFSTYQGNSSISLTSTSNSYAASHFYVDNPDYEDPQIVEPDLEKDTAYKLGAFEPDSYSYKYFNGSRVSSSYLDTTDVYSEAVDVYATEQPYDGVEDSYTLSFVSDNALKYISNNGSSTNVSLADNPCLWVWDEELEVFARVVGGRSLVLYTSTSSGTITGYSIRAYEQTETNLANPHVALISKDPGTITRPAVTSIAVTTAAGETSGTVEEGKTLQLSAAIEPEHALTDVTWTSDNEECATVSEDGLVSGVAATTEGSPVTITATSVSTPSVSGSIQITVTAPEPLVYKESETITADEISSQYNVSSGSVVPTLYLSLTTVSWGTTSSSTGNSKYYNSTQTNPSNQIRVYNKDTITFTPVDETIATISKIVFEHDAESVQGGDACTLKDSSNNDAGTITKQSTTAPYTVTLDVSASGAVTFTNTGSSNVQLHFTSMTIYYSDPTAANTGR